jgi:hypothetical protein
MTPSDLSKQFRLEMDDHCKSISSSDSDVLFCQDLVDFFIDQSERQAAENGMLIFDRNTDFICTIPLIKGIPIIKNEKIIKIDRIFFLCNGSSEKVEISIKSFEEYDAENPEWRTRNFSENLTCFVVGQKIEPAGEIDVEGMLFLEVYRYPIESAVGCNSFEIDEKHHYWLIYWMKYLAYNKRDSDTYSPQLAEYNKKIFENRFGFQKTCDTWQYASSGPLVTSYCGI